jgi:hypothetical protein
MVEFSCLFSLFENQYKWAIFHNSNEKKDVAVFFKFIKYEKFIKIELRNKSIILKIENLKNHQLLFQYYIASLLCSIKYTDIKKDYYYVLSPLSTIQKWLIHYLNFNTKLWEKEFNRIKYSQEPKRESSIKKQKKFLKLLNYYIEYDNFMIDNPLIIIENLIELYLNFIKELEYQIINYENKIYFLSCVRGFNRDIYMTFKEIFDNDNDKKLILPFIISNIK